MRRDLNWRRLVARHAWRTNKNSYDVTNDHCRDVLGCWATLCVFATPLKDFAPRLNRVRPCTASTDVCFTLDTLNICPSPWHRHRLYEGTGPFRIIRISIRVIRLLFQNRFGFVCVQIGFTIQHLHNSTFSSAKKASRIVRNRPVQGHNA